MFLVPQDVLRRFQEDERVNEGLDTEMMKIIKLKRLEDSKKWYLYRQQLMKYASSKRNGYVGGSHPADTKHLFDRGTQVNIRPPHNPSPIRAAKATQTKNNNEHICETFHQGQDDDIDFSALTSPTNRKVNEYDYENIQRNLDELLNEEMPPANPRRRSRRDFTAFEHISTPPNDPQPSPISAKTAAKSTLNRRKVLKRGVDDPDQLTLDFPIRKIPRTFSNAGGIMPRAKAKRRSKSLAKDPSIDDTSQIKRTSSRVKDQTGENAFKWTCMK